MRTSLNITNKLTKLSEMRGESIFQVLEFDELNGGTDVETSIKLKFMRDSGIKLKQVRIILEDSAVKLESGVLSYLKGNIELNNKFGGVIGLGKKLLTSKVTGETAFKPRYEGIGEIFLEPSFGHFGLIELEDEEIIVDDGLFYACEDTVEVGAAMQKSISSMMMGNEGIFQTKLSGSGVIVLELPVPETEIFKCKLINDTLKVDGNFTILRTAGIGFTVEKSAKSLIGSATSGEGFLNVYKGTGEVWLVPTNSVYRKLSGIGLKSMTNPEGTSNAEV
ncbi:transcriptional regulator [Clostridium polyendosporum]|uniref:Transcriptional regulator n=1 Tax=Clostridium polyendosporum TaxID=69208 RepID=A0A919S1A1_9CLOT|nr:AIM24 family protein [Clostridium polyendosporum]GIM29962.1 transcriptional regulator [Clostridium polyendosporum]